MTLQAWSNLDQAVFPALWNEVLRAERDVQEWQRQDAALLKARSK